MSDTELQKKWEETQLNWKDDILDTASFLTKKRWDRINEKVIDILSKEVINKNEYLEFLDIGAGKGDFYKKAENLLKKYVGIEPSYKMLEYEINEEDFELKRGKGEELNEIEKYDVVLLKEVLDHCYSPETVIKNSYNALKQNGIMIITLTNKNAYYKLIFKKIAKKLEEKHKDHLFNFSPQEVKKILIDNNFKIEKIISLNYLKLPFFLENALKIIPQKILNKFLDVFDAFMGVILKEKGGSFIIVARK